MALGYRTEIGLEQGFEKSIQWYRKHFKELEKQFLVQLKI
jgi:nucleoside-diphosphate-sugar epimerase